MQNRDCVADGKTGLDEPAESSIVTLLSAVGKGSQTAASEVHGRLFGLVRTIARKHLSPVARPAWSSEDVASITFTRLFLLDSLSSRFACSGAVVRFLAKTTKCRALDINRHETRGKRTTPSLSTERVAEPESHASPDGAVEAADTLAHIASARPYGDQAMQMLVDGWTHREVAEAVGESRQVISYWLKAEAERWQ